MQLGENIVCGTTTTGTGTLTLAACPAAIGGINPVTAFGTTGAFPIPYTIIEYTDSTFVTPKQGEVGVDVLTLAATITSATQNRTPRTTWVVATPAYSGTASAPTAITIGTAANTLVFIGPNAQTVVQGLHYYSLSGITSADALGFSPVQGCAAAATTNTMVAGTSTGNTWYQRVWLPVGGLIKTVSLRQVGAMTSATLSTFQAALYDINSSGLPGKQIISFASPSAGCLNTATTTVSPTATTAVFVNPGFYILGMLPIGGTGSSGSPTFRASTSIAPSPFGTQMASGTVGGPLGLTVITAQSTLADPATTTSIASIITANENAVAFRST